MRTHTHKEIQELADTKIPSHPIILYIHKQVFPYSHVWSTLCNLLIYKDIASVVTWRWQTHKYLMWKSRAFLYLRNLPIHIWGFLQAERRGEILTPRHSYNFLSKQACQKNASLLRVFRQWDDVAKSKPKPIAFMYPLQTNSFPASILRLAPGSIHAACSAINRRLK